jgi:hypothetical protein
MSEKRLSLSNPIVVVVVLVLFAAVLVVNLRTFGFKNRPQTAQAEVVQGYPTLPVDLEQVLRRSAVAGPSSGGLVAGSPLPALGRDPFAARKSRTKPVAVEKALEPVTIADPDSLACAAVMLGGRRPVALINGEPLAVGDRIRGFQVMKIETTGVSLQHSDGRSRFLIVGRSGASSKSYRMVTDVPDREDLGRTSLDDSAYEERQRP